MKYTFSGTATPNTDYTSSPTASITISEGKVTGTIIITSSPDIEQGVDENCTITLKSTTGLATKIQLHSLQLSTMTMMYCQLY